MANYRALKKTKDMYYNEDEVKRIKDAAAGRLLDVVKDFQDLRTAGKDYTCTCPKCHAEKKLTIAASKDVFKCWSCQLGGKGAVAYLMNIEGYGYIDALDYLAKKFTVILDPRPEKPTVKPKPVLKAQSKEAKGEDVNSFCARMLAASGLTVADVTASVYKSDDTKSTFETRTFRKGTINDRGQLDYKGDDCIIEYYDLDGFPVRYTPKDSKRRDAGATKEYFRVRWQFPDAHLDKDGKPFKYRSPRGSGTPIYIPEKIRAAYKNGTTIPRLFIQEGEKKAEKACKHGIPSIAVSGIQNLGTNGSLPEDFVRIIQKCQVKEVAFIFDSDWQDISTNIKINDQVEKRPRCFYYAAKNFKEYMRSLKNRDLYVEAFIGHINKNEAEDKGLDDLLANTLKGKEDELAKDIEFACNDKRGLGKYVEMIKVTGFTDHKLAELWCLHSHEAFAARHKELLQGLPEFLFGKYRWKFDEDGKVVLAQPFDADEEFWKVVIKNKGKENERVEYEFCYVNSQNFLNNRGFGRLRRSDGSFQFIHLNPPVVESIEAHDARDYLFQFAKHNCSLAVQEMLIKGVSQYVGPDKLSLLDYIEPAFIKPSLESQYFYFDKSCWLVTKDEVQELGYESIHHHIWDEQKRPNTVKYLGKPLIRFYKDGDNYDYELTKEGAQCHFLKFLINTSNFTWRKQMDEIDPEEMNENNIHLLSKMCAIGFMLMEGKDANVTRAVIGMDGKQSEVGESNGRSGKSLIGELMRNVMPIAYIPGKRADIFNDQFIWNDVQEKTQLVFIDDVLQSFNFEQLFPNLTGDWSVNYKGGRRITLSFEQSPKVYITTNHAIKGSGGSFKDRQWLLAFSDFYNDTHKPKDDFGVMFFSEWDFEQWNLCWNMLATCVQLYLTHGVVQAPGERLEDRKLRQEIGETFISWAEEYYSDENHIGCRTPKKELYDALCEYDPAQRKFTSPTAFKSKFKMYCEWRGFVFNPQKYDAKTGKPFNVDKDGRPVIDDKASGVEYFTVGLAAGDKAMRKDPMGLPEKESKLDF